MSSIFLTRVEVEQRLHFHEQRLLALKNDKKNPLYALHEFQVNRFKAARMETIHGGKVDITKYNSK